LNGRKKVDGIAQFDNNDWLSRVVGILYLVSTPIGNLEDITLRALRVLQHVSLIAAEDTRTTRKLLSHYDIHTPLTSYNEHNRRAKTPRLLEALAHGDLALVSEAGTPAISDPGQHLVAAAWEAGYQVAPVPGPSVLTAALAASGLSTRRFLFLGFLPRQQGPLRKLLRSLRDTAETLVAFEAPHRVRATLLISCEELGDRRAAVCRELTKVHEEVFRGRLSEALEHFSEPRGEFTLVVEGCLEDQRAAEPRADLSAEIQRLRAAGVPAREAVPALSARFGLSRRQLYRLWLAASAPRNRNAGQ
jgi:16S rRNA (cytidine1402-2'-O)-methyltransferase